MPTLVRFLIVLAVILAVGYGVMILLVTVFHPTPHEISQPVALPKQEQTKPQN